jgi:hypothetical protein
MRNKYMTRGKEKMKGSEEEEGGKSEREENIMHRRILPLNFT